MFVWLVLCIIVSTIDINTYYYWYILAKLFALYLQCLSEWSLIANIYDTSAPRAEQTSVLNYFYWYGQPLSRMTKKKLSFRHYLSCWGIFLVKFRFICNYIKQCVRFIEI